MAKRRVGELMNPDVVTLRPTMTVREAQKLLTERRVTGAPVLDDEGHILGIVSQNDLMRFETRDTTAGDEGQFFTSVEDYVDLGKVPADRSATPIEKIMQRKVFTVGRDTGVATAANIMRERRIHRLLVIEKNILVGVISSFDLLRVVEEAC